MKWPKFIQGSLITFAMTYVPQLQAATQPEIWFHPAVPIAEREAINNYFATLATIKNDLSVGSPDLALFLNLSDETAITGAQLREWLLKRIKYVLPDKFDFGNKIKLTNELFNTKNVGVLPSAYALWHVYPANKEWSKQPSVGSFASVRSIDDQKSKISALNVGGTIGITAQYRGLAISVDIDNPAGPILVRSPQSGIFQIGPALLHQVNSNSLSPVTRVDPAYNLVQLALFFHEGHHSDGVGESASFGHIICPPFHDLAGAPGCDFALNGAYALEFEILRAFRRAKTQTKDKNWQYLSLQMADRYNRILHRIPAGQDPARIETLQKEISDVELLTKKDSFLDHEIGEELFNAQVLRETVKILLEGKNASWLDAAPGPL